MHVPQVALLHFLFSLLNRPATTISIDSEFLEHLRAQDVRCYLRVALLLVSVFLARILSERFFKNNKKISVSKNGIQILALATLFLVKLIFFFSVLI